MPVIVRAMGPGADHTTLAIDEKVAAAAIDALGVYVDGFASCFVESALARLLPKLFLKADGKPTRAGVERAV